MLPIDIIDALKQMAYWADRECRAELIEGYISTENDYTSNLTASLRRKINARQLPGLHATSFVVPPQIERSTGTDAAIILATEGRYKIGLFEAKWPRLASETQGWDAVQRSSGQSHFCDQIARQTPGAGAFAIWEMFYCELAFGERKAIFPIHGSSCVWHADALAVSQRRDSTKPWSETDLTELLTSQFVAFGDVIEAIALCRVGQLMQGENYLQQFSEFKMSVPRHILVIRFDPSKRHPAVRAGTA
jgi:hypothetical protein